MLIDGMSVPDNSPFKIPNGTTLPVVHQKGYLFLLVPTLASRPTLYASNGTTWYPVIASVDLIANSTTAPYLTASNLLPADWNAVSGSTRILNKPARYLKRHSTTTNGTLTVTWPTGRFTTTPVVHIQPIMPTISGSPDTTHMYTALILTCSEVSMSFKLIRHLIGSVPILVGGNVLIGEVPAVAVDVMIRAEAATD